jgi:signal transduction histidine kinase
MWRRLKLTHRVYALLGGLLLVTAAGGLIMWLYVGRMEQLLTVIVRDDMAAFESAQALENALISQRGFVTYFFLDGDPRWLRQLEESRRLYRDRYQYALSMAVTPRKREAMARIAAEYDRYIAAKDEVVALYVAGKRTEGAALHQKVRNHFFDVLDLCEAYKQLNKELMMAAKAAGRAEAKNMRIAAALAVLLGLTMGGLLAAILARNVLGPVRRLARETEAPAEIPALGTRTGDDISALSQRVRGLIENVDQTRSELARSRETLLQAEKMAMVGKLAAGMAHGIRNPFTSIQMRLFSLSRGLKLTPTQREDFEVIHREIRQVDTILGNFLEFSRPPRLRMQQISPSAVVDMALQLLEHRLRSYHVEVRLNRQRPLPAVSADPEQLKEVLVNLVINACEAMGRDRSGIVTVTERDEIVPGMGRVAAILVGDNGPGIPAELTGKVFQPFFTTRETGTGLGLSIAHRIIHEHGGRLTVSSEEGEGAVFRIVLPAGERSGQTRDGSPGAAGGANGRIFAGES